MESKIIIVVILSIYSVLTSLWLMFIMYNWFTVPLNKNLIVCRKCGKIQIAHKDYYNDIDFCCGVAKKDTWRLKIRKASSREWKVYKARSL